MGKALYLLLLMVFGTLSVISQPANTGCSTEKNPWPASLHTGLVAWYPFNGNANDESGNGNNSTTITATLTADRYGLSNSAYHLDSTQYIMGDCSKFPTTTRTISFWYKAKDFTLNNDAFGYGGNGSCGTSWITIFAANVFGVAGHCSYFDSFAPNALPLYDNWHNVIVSYNGNNIKVYTDGCLAFNEARGPVNTVVTDKSFFIGAIPGQDGVNPYNFTGHHYWVGDLDDLGIWDRPLTDAEVKIVSQPVCQPTIAISSNLGQAICDKASPEFSAAIENYAGQVTYQWLVNNVSVFPNSSTYTGNSLVNGDVVNCILLSESGCILDTSNSLAMTVKANQPLSVTIESDDGDNSICSGSQVTFDATVLNAGGAPTYQWTVNGNNAGTNSPTFTIATLADNAIVSCLLTAGGDICSTGNPAMSNTIQMAVIPIQTVSVNISSDDADNIICKGAAVNFIALATSGGTSPLYQWKLNGSNTGNAASSYSGNTFRDKDIIQCVATSNAACAVPATMSSNSIVLHVPASIYLGKDTGFCLADGLTLQVKDTFSVYQWSTGANNSFITISKSGTYWLQTQDKYNCISTDTVHIAENYCGFAIPTAFTPNNDGRNDLFKPVLSGTVTTYNFTIYDRWGKKIFSTNRLSTGWDGYYKNQLQISGAYAWVCEFQLAGQLKVTKKGSVLLIR